MIAIPFFSRRPPVRVPHDESRYCQPDFAAQYNADVGKFTGDFRPILRYVASQLDPARQADVLEIGPGPGWIGIRLAQSHPAVRVTGIDISAAFVAIANENSRREGVADRAVFILGDAAEMNGLADGSFDVVVSYQSLHYWDPLDRALNQIARVLRPSGVFCLGDDRRDMNWLGRLEMRLKRCFISRPVGTAWALSVSGCLTPAEAAEALQRSDLRDRWQIAIRQRSMLITSKPPAS
jgi:ubiquinone/menaquinone biosynthesis C-methylase UbiE